ncbi:MAG: hypothetical protein WB952_23825 [Terriglobales bacterium]
MREESAHAVGGSKSTEDSLFRGHRGGVISMHRALTHFRLGPMNLVISISLFFVFSAIWVVLLPILCRFWNRLLGLSLRFLPLSGTLEVATHRFSTTYWLDIPYLRIYSVLPSLWTWSLSCGVTLLLFAATYLLPRRLAPILYLSRGILLVQATSLFYFALWPLHFPHAPDSYMEALITSGIGLISVIPLLFGLTFYIFDFGLWKKALLTALTMAHLTVFLPFQVVLQALVLQTTVLFMPVLYIIFGMPVDVLLIIAWYSWGMTWSFRPTATASH